MVDSWDFLFTWSFGGSFNLGRNEVSEPNWSYKMYEHLFTLPKTNMDTQNDGLEKVIPFKHGNFWYLC